MKLSLEEQQFILQNYEYDPKTGKFWSKIKQQEVGHHKQEYILLVIKGKKICAHHLAFLFMTNSLPDLSDGKIVHHKNNNPSDNRWSNLEITTKFKNARYSIARENGTSKFRGVSFDAECQRWRVILNINHIIYNLGRFDDENQAAKIYDDFLIYKNPETNRKYLNFPKRKSQDIPDKLKTITGVSRKTTLPPKDLLLFELKKRYEYHEESGLIFNKENNKFIYGSPNKFGYLVICFKHENYKQHIKYHRVVWFLSTNQWDLENKVIDHIDRNPTNNRIENLRLISSQENSLNRNKRKDNKSGYIGVSYITREKKWGTNTKYFNFTINGGLFSSKEEAAERHDDLMFYLHQEKAKLNFPDRKPELPPQKIINKIEQIKSIRNSHT